MIKYLHRLDIPGLGWSSSPIFYLLLAYFVCFWLNVTMVVVITSLMPTHRILCSSINGAFLFFYVFYNIYRNWAFIRFHIDLSPIVCFNICNDSHVGNPLLVSVNHFFFLIFFIIGLSSLSIFKPFIGFEPKSLLFAIVGEL